MLSKVDNSRLPRESSLPLKTLTENSEQTSSRQVLTGLDWTGIKSLTALTLGIRGAARAAARNLPPDESEAPCESRGMFDKHIFAPTLPLDMAHIQLESIT